MILTRKNYFSPKASRVYMSVSQFKAFEKCPACAMAEISGRYKRETTTALLVGQFVDAHFDGEADSFCAEHPEIFTGKGELKADFKQALDIIARMGRDKKLMKFMDGEKQVIMTGEIAGVPVKIMMDSFHPGKMIVDRKIVKDFEDIRVPEQGYLPWFEAWGYDLQGAVYQEIVRQNTGHKLPFYLAAATKEKVTDIDLIHITQSTLDFQLDRFAENAPRYDAMKKRIIPADRCEKCEFCKQTKKIKAPTESSDYYF